MRLTPLDIREQQFRRVMRGMDPEEVSAFLASVAGEFESLLAENKELRQRHVDLEEKLTEYRNMEKALRDTLLTAERVMTESKESAQREARLIVREAELAAQRATARISQDVARIRRDLEELRRTKDAYLGRLRWLVRSHAEMIDGHAQEFAEVDAGITHALAETPNVAAVPPAPAPPHDAQPPEHSTPVPAPASGGTASIRADRHTPV
ncbi:MAG: DivIVA domain-containing protein [Candidatus Latescibacterota bacterium]|nr:MAG: DivIVA domain-containing protein [Candidatus Latescibacterota bacterium]